MGNRSNLSGLGGRDDFEVYCVHSMVKWWCQGCVQGHARRVEAENGKLRVQVTDLREALFAARAELSKWGFGDFHYGNTPRDPDVLATIAVIDKVLGSDESAS